jgi:proteasome beta subunit
MTVDQGIDIAIRAIDAAKKRDSASGGLTNIAVITKDGFKEISQDEIKKRIDKLVK